MLLHITPPEPRTNATKRKLPPHVAEFSRPLVKKSKHSNSGRLNAGRRIEQYDKDSGEVLFRYHCQTDACVAMGLPTHYLSYRVFGEGSESHSCVFGWREVSRDAPLYNDSFADLRPLRVYIQTYLDHKPADDIPTWKKFLDGYTPPILSSAAEETADDALSSLCSGRRVMEQYDRATDKILRRYPSMAEASVALGQPAHYLQYKVFGRGARFHNCVFGWRELPPNSVVEPREGEVYADLDRLQIYMASYLQYEGSIVPTWREFEANYVANPTGDCNLTSEAEHEVIEQYDLETGQILRRYASHYEASIAMGQNPNYLQYFVFSMANVFKKSYCVFGWRKIVGDNIDPQQGEEYAQIEFLRLYMERYLKRPLPHRPSWLKFLRKQPEFLRAVATERVKRKIELIAERSAAKIAAKAEKSAIATAAQKVRRSNNKEVGAGNKVMEQRDLKTNRVLRRYASMAEACFEMGQPSHYLPYKVFGKGSKSHNCVFKWSELQGIHTVAPGNEEVYEDTLALRAYMRKYLKRQSHEIPCWDDFVVNYDPQQDSEGEQADLGCKDVPDIDYSEYELSEREKTILTAMQV